MMNNRELQDEEFEMLLSEVLDTIANPEPTDGLQQKVMLRLHMAQVEEMEPVERPTLSGGRVLLFAGPLASRRSLSSTAFAIGLHAAAILLIALLVGSRMRTVTPRTDLRTFALIAPPPPVFPKFRVMGGGGGQPGVAPVGRGAPPKFSAQQLVPPKLSPLLQPRIAVEPTIDVQKDIKMPSALLNLGLLNAPDVGVSMGNRRGNGLGSGNGDGMGPGSGGDTGGGVKQVGGGVSAPIEIYRVDPEFSEEARKAKLTGDVLVSLLVDSKGRVTHVHVIKGLGMGLDEKAVEAVKQFRFKPAMENGKPVTVEVNIDVNFQIF